MRHALAPLVCLLVAGTAAAVMPGTDLFVPAVAHGQGSGGAQWRADLWIYNPSTAQSANVTVYLLLRQPNPAPASQPVTILAGGTAYFRDVVGTGLFGQSESYGGLRITSDIPVVATAESYNANVTTTRGTGTSGQFFGGVPAALAFGNGDATDVIGLDQDAAKDTGLFRSNLGLVETTGAGNTVSFVLDRLNPDGSLVGSWACDGTNPACAPLGPWEVRQFNYVLSNFAPATGANQRIRIRVTGGSGRLVAAGSRIDNVTGDPSTIEMSGGGRAGSYLCKVARSDYETPFTLTVDQGAVTALDATILFTDADVPSCGGQVLRLSGPLQQPVYYDDNGAFNFVVTNPNVGGAAVSFTVAGTLTVTGAAAGNVTVTLGNVTGCTGTKSWPFTGAKAR